MGCYDAYHEQEKHACGLSTLFSKEKECVVVSIGSQNLWVFEEAIYQNTSCRIEVFDCTVPGASPPTHIQVLLAWLCGQAVASSKGRR